MYLPLANLLHHKLRSALSALGIGIGICMLVTLSGLSRGSLYEIADRWEAVDADLFAYPQIWGGDVTNLSGVGLPDRYGEKILRAHGRIVQRVVPVFFWQVNLGGQDQLAAGVDPQDWAVLSGGRRLSRGRLFDPDNAFGEWIVNKLLAPPEEGAEDVAIEIPDAELAHPDHNGLEIVIDERLAKAGGLELDQVVEMANHRFRIVGIAPAGGLSRVYMPRRTAQFLFGSGNVTMSTLLFIRLRAGADADAAARKLAGLGLEIAQLSQYRHMLERRFGIMFVYVDAVNAVAMVIAFLFIMITLYTMVLQRTRDIAILKSSGASKSFIVRQLLAESILLTGAGMAAGIVLSLLAGMLIEFLRPLLTVTITWEWIARAGVAAAAGALLSALYPAWLATRVDMVEVLACQ